MSLVFSISPRFLVCIFCWQTAKLVNTNKNKTQLVFLREKTGWDGWHGVAVYRARQASQFMQELGIDPSEVSIELDELRGILKDHWGFLEILRDS